jgi:dipeptidase E
MGGLSFGLHPHDVVLHDHVLGLARGPEPRICLLPTASGDADAQIASFHAAFGDRPCRPSHVALFRLGRRPVALEEHLLAQDIVYVGGGALVNLLAIWRAHGVDRILTEAWRRGTVLAGFSAGAMCWFEAGVTTSAGPPRTAAALGLLPGSACVHYDSEPARRLRYLEGVRGELPDGYGIDDGVGLVFEDDRLVAAVTGRPHACAYRVEHRGHGVAEQPLDVERLAAGRDPPPDLREYRRVLRLRERFG